ncbi:MarC family transcriptional regulator [Thalassobacter stenotrophicus]|uniref:MarC family protein n=1 Tax=Thalassobacter TaxID=266808 RepID=UPI00051D2E50|nr:MULTISPECIES: MarC family protein [Thalassobacter]KGK80191.1 MarC family transcriptional regulator [Thalassobacter stenotrophicus]KGL01178.1 MarC family transcriptional regulator [Thalassobacter sp. 16PALIMAR09]
MTQAEAITAFVALFVIIDPIGLAPLFIALTRGAAPRARFIIGARAVAVAAALLLLFGLAGEAVLDFLGISLPAFQIAGGILLFLTALDMLFDRRTKRREDQAHTLEEDPSIFPLAMPLIAGPGAIATVILLSGQAQGDPLYLAQVMGVAALVLGGVLLLFSLASPVERLLGPTGINVVTRLLGMLLAALSVQFVLNGILAIWPN